LFFMAEYTKMIAISSIAATMFFGGYLGPFVDQLPWLGPVYMFGKIVALLFGMIWVRATLPRIRYDRLMSFGWKVMLPLSLALVVVAAIGILLRQINPLFIWFIPLVSLFLGFMTIALVDRSLRRKAHALV